MSVVEIEHRRSRRAQAKHHKQAKRKQKVRARPVGIGHNLGPLLLAALNDDQVLTFNEWCRLNAISPRNGRRIIKSGTGPRVVHLSARRIGITVKANREWQAAREQA